MRTGSTASGSRGPHGGRWAVAEEPVGPVPQDGSSAATQWSQLPEEEQAVLLKVSEILQRIQFGTVVLVVQDGKVVQIEMAEKFRLR
jgi:hypothetical protein